MNLRNFFAELKRRNVYKVAIAYGVVAWLVIQVATQVFPFFDIPNWTVRLVVLVIVIGFPIALIIAWAFELTPQGLKRTEVADTLPARPPPTRAWIYVAITAGVLAVGLFFFGRFMVWNFVTQRNVTSEPPAKSIAVLPFENLSEEKSNAYFAEGIQDEILTRLAKIADLKVISRTSTQRYKSSPDDLPQIAKQLGAAHVLEGSVQRVADQVRVNVQLINAATDAHLWAESYDRKLTDIFKVESEIATRVAAALQAKLSPADTQSLTQIPTRDVEAHNLYLQAGVYLRQVESSNGDPATLLPKALALYGEAIARDPSFALASAQASYVHSWMHFYGVDDSPARLQLAEDAARQALALSPQLPEAHLAMGFIAYWCKRDYATALAEFEQARKSLPNDVRVATAIAWIHRRRGEWQEAINEFSRAETLDPRDSDLPNDRGWTLALARRYPEALEDLRRSLALQPDYWNSFVLRALIDMFWHGDIAAAQNAMRQSPAGVDPQGQVTFVRFEVAMWSRDFAGALKIVEGAPPWISSDPVHRRVPSVLLRAEALEAAGKSDEAHKAYAEAIHLLEAEVNVHSESPGLHGFLGRAYAGAGRKVEATRESRRAVDLQPVSSDAFDGPFYLEQLAEIQARVDNVDEALLLIRQVLDMPAGLALSPAALKLDPVWDPIRKDPRFQELISKK